MTMAWSLWERVKMDWGAECRAEREEEADLLTVTWNLWDALAHLQVP